MENDDNSMQKAMQDEEEQWRSEHEGWFECPYCGEATRELIACCGERHGEQIKAQEWHEHNRILLDQIAEVTDGIVTEGKAWNERMAKLESKNDQR